MPIRSRESDLADIAVGGVPVMLPETFETRGRTTRDGVLNLSVSVGVPDTDVVVVVQLKPLAPQEGVDANGWPEGFFERVAGSMPELERGPQGEFEERRSIE